MSLDVYLEGPGESRECECPRCYTPHVRVERPRLYQDNVTHNLGKMANAAGIYSHLWRPEEIGISTAAQLIEPLAAGLALLDSDPARFRKFNPPNGWGDYDGLVDFVRDYLRACREHPTATVRVSR